MKTILLATAAVMGLASATLADGIVIGAGQEGRGYDAYAKTLSARLDGSTVVNFAGSDEISLAVCDGDVMVAPVQNDARYQRSKEGCDLRILGEYGNQEYAFILFPEGSDYNELSDLSANDKVLVDEIGSGTDLFWTTINDVEAEHGNGSSWTQATRVNDMFLFADGMAAGGDLDAVIYVGDPQDAQILDFLTNGWTVGELYDKDINDMTFNGESLYENATVNINVPGQFFNEKNDAYVVRSFIVANADALRADRKLARDLALAVKATK